MAVGAGLDDFFKFILEADFFGCDGFFKGEGFVFAANFFIILGESAIYRIAKQDDEFAFGHDAFHAFWGEGVVDVAGGGFATDEFATFFFGKIAFAFARHIGAVPDEALIIVPVEIVDFFLVGRGDGRVGREKIIKSGGAAFLGSNNEKIGQGAAGAFEDGLKSGETGDVLIQIDGYLLVCFPRGNGVGRFTLIVGIRKGVQVHSFESKWMEGVCICACADDGGDFCLAVWMPRPIRYQETV